MNDTNPFQPRPSPSLLPSPPQTWRNSQATPIAPQRLTSNYGNIQGGVRHVQAEVDVPTEPLPVPRQTVRVPLEPTAVTDKIKMSSAQDRISLAAVDAPLNVLLAMIAEQHGLNIVTGSEASELITIKLTDAPLNDAFDVLLSTHGYTWNRQKNIIIVSKITGDSKSSADIQGREVRVFALNYLTATDADNVVKGLLSPVGQSFTNQSMASDHRRTHEQLIVEDLPESLRRIEYYLAQADTPPRQVLIEAHVLQINLKDNCRHGVNLQEMLTIANADITLATVGLATGVPPVSSLRIDGSQLTGLLEAIKATTDSKTLASPKVAVLNNQEAHLQVGSKIGYLLTTTTQTSTLQSVDFLDVGVILKVTPSIAQDGQILIQVNPQVSTGRINATTQLPESETTEVATRVMLGDGEAIVIGGLIKETDIDNQIKIPFLGDLWLVGWMFQRREITRERNEIIVTLLPRIIPQAAGERCLEPWEVQRAHTPLLYGPLLPVDRTEFEPQLPKYTDRPPHCHYLPGLFESSVPIESPSADGEWETPAFNPANQPSDTYDPQYPVFSVETSSYRTPAAALSRLPPTHLY